MCVFKKSVKVLGKTETKMFTFVDIGTVVWLLRAYGGESGCRRHHLVVVVCFVIIKKEGDDFG